VDFNERCVAMNFRTLEAIDGPAIGLLFHWIVELKCVGIVLRVQNAEIGASG
jgi:hypothetical protein